jgi:hypothetical protein
MAFGAGWFLRDRRAKADEDLSARLSALVGAMDRLSTDRLVLVMIEKGRTPELTPYLTRRMAEDLTSARKTLTETPGSVGAMYARFPWVSALLPNVTNAFRVSGEYLERHGEHSEAVRDAKWLVAATSAQGEK